MSLSNINIQQYSEVAGVGITAAMNTLSTILSSTINTNCGEAVIKDIASSDYNVLQPALYFNIAFSGDLQGRAVAVFRKIDLSVILKFLMNSDSDNVEFDEMGLGMIKEIMAQISSEFASKIGDFFGLDVTATISGLMDFTDNSVISTCFDCDDTKDIVNVSFKYEIGTVLKGRGIFTFNENFVKTINDVYLGNSLVKKPEKNAEQQNVPDNKKQSAPDINVQPAQFPKFTANNSTGAPIFNGNMNLLMDVPLNVCVEIGKTKKRMKDIMNFTQGTVIPIDKQAGAPVDITVNGQLIARGDVIVIDDNFGVRITELIGNDLTEQKK